MSWLLLLVGSATVNLLAAELFDWFPWLAERLIRLAVRKLPSDARDRYLDEWLAELEAVPGRGISKLMWATQILVRATKVGEEIVGHSTRNRGGVAFAVKSVIDRVWAAGSVVLFAPVLLSAALAVRANFKRPGVLPPATRRSRRQGVLSLQVPLHAPRPGAGQAE